MVHSNVTTRGSRAANGVRIETAWPLQRSLDVMLAASLRGQARQLRFEFGRIPQVHEASVGCIDSAANRRQPPDAA